MGMYLISYDLRGQEKDYPKLFEKIQAYGTWCHALKSAWFISTPDSAQSIATNLEQTLDADDLLIVTGAAHSASWTDNFPKEITDWLMQNL